MRQIKISERITDRRELTVDKYISELQGKEYDKLTPDQEYECAELIQKGDQKALDKLVKANLRFVISVAKQYSHAAPLMDLINEGNVGMIKAAQKFDHTRGFKFISYAVWWIRQSIMKYLNENGRLVKLPLNRIQAIGQLDKIQEKLRQDLGRDPSEEEMEELYLETDYAKKHRYKNIDDIINLNRKPLSLDFDMSRGSEKDEFTLLDMLSSSEEVHDPMRLDSIKIELNRILSHLKYVEKQILEMYYGLNGNNPHTLEQIGEILELSKERIRQIKSRAERRLRHGFSSKKILRQYL